MTDKKMRVEFEMSDADLDILMDSFGRRPDCKVHCQSGNGAWAALGDRMGFAPMSVLSVNGKADNFFTATPRESALQRCERKKFEEREAAKKLADREMQLAIAEMDGKTGARMIDGVAHFGHRGTLPNYLNDLNAIQAAVLRLPEDERVEFARKLAMATVEYDDEWTDETLISCHGLAAVLKATPRQWCEALVAMKGLEE